MDDEFSRRWCSPGEFAFRASYSRPKNFWKFPVQYTILLPKFSVILHSRRLIFSLSYFQRYNRFRTVTYLRGSIWCKLSVSLNPPLRLPTQVCIVLHSDASRLCVPTFRLSACSWLQIRRRYLSSSTDCSFWPGGFVCQLTLGYYLHKTKCSISRHLKACYIPSMIYFNHFKLNHGSLLRFTSN